MRVSTGDPGELLEDVRCVVKSPGIRPDATVVRRACELDRELIDEAELGWRLDDRPLIGVSGTNGKSTVVALLAATLEAAGARPAIAGNTLFGPPLSGLAAGAGDVVIAELSSFQLQYCPGLLPDAAVLTNVGDDHWDWHGGRREYLTAKRRLLFSTTGHVPAAAIGVDSGETVALERELGVTGAEVVGFGLGSATCRVVGSSWTLQGGTVALDLRGERLDLETRLPGEHNALNVAAAASAAAALGIDADHVRIGVRAAEPVPGRFEVLGRTRAGADVVVDYAHNPGGLRALLATLRAVVAPRGGRLIVVASVLVPVVDERQRREMGRVLGQEAECAVLTLERVTSAEPADRPPAGLREGVQEAGGESEFVPDRATAIERAIELAGEGDIVAVVNRGPRVHYLDLEGRPGQFDDRAVVRELLEGARV